jgi:hypothetical protein
MHGTHTYIVIAHLDVQSLFGPALSKQYIVCRCTSCVCKLSEKQGQLRLVMMVMTENVWGWGRFDADWIGP